MSRSKKSRGSVTKDWIQQVQSATGDIAAPDPTVLSKVYSDLKNKEANNTARNFSNTIYQSAAQETGAGEGSQLAENYKNLKTTGQPQLPQSQDEVNDKNTEKAKEFSAGVYNPANNSSSVNTPDPKEPDKTLSNADAAEVQQSTTSVPAMSQELNEEIGDKLLVHAGNSINQLPQDPNEKTNKMSTDWVKENTLKAMQDINNDKGASIYDLNSINKLFNQSSANLIDSIAKISGYEQNTDVQKGALPNGTLIGIERGDTPEWAKGRTNNISSVVQVMTVNGNTYVSEVDQGAKSGVKLTPYNDWYSQEVQNKDRLYATNPFNIVSAANVANRAHNQAQGNVDSPGQPSLEQTQQSQPSTNGGSV